MVENDFSILIIYFYYLSSLYPLISRFLNLFITSIIVPTYIYVSGSISVNSISANSVSKIPFFSFKSYYIVVFCNRDSISGIVFDLPDL